MNSHAIRLFRVVAAIVAAGSWSAVAQQPIVFSKPADSAGAAKPDSNLAPETKHETHGFFSIPQSVFEPNHSELNIAPFSSSAPAPQASPSQMREWQKILDAKNHWTLMTPAEILGIPTPEKILGLPAKDGGDKLSPEERFTRRRDKSAASLLETSAAAKAVKRSDMPISNNESPFARKTFESVFARVDEKNSSQQQPTSAGGAGTAGKGGSLFGAMLGSFAADEKSEARWGNTFNFPAQPPKATPQQLAGMERFRESMQPSLVFQKAAEQRRPTPLAARDPFMNVAPQFNPRGSSFAPLKSDVSRPMGLTSLPGITTRLPVTPTRSAAQPDLPPWMRDDSGKIPQRKF